MKICAVKDEKKSLYFKLFTIWPILHIDFELRVESQVAKSNILDSSE